MNQLQALKQWTTVVADTGNFKELETFAPQDATTNPSLILRAVQKSDYQALFKSVVAHTDPHTLNQTVDRLLVRFGCEILQRIPGRVSTEVDARLSFDTSAMVQRAQNLTALYQAEGIDTAQRVLIKLAATWEGIAAGEQLERHGIHTNMTLLFSLPQAVQCAQAQVRLISPFVGRIYDWHKKAAGTSWDEAAQAGINDPGVRCIWQIYHYYKKWGIPTQIMGASFRNLGQIAALVGCDLLTISPELLTQLAHHTEALPRQLHPDTAHKLDIPKLQFTEASFRYALNQDAMAVEKLAEGIRLFSADAVALDQLILAA